MILNNSHVLVTRNARDKIQVVKTELYQDGNTFYIKRFTGQYQGKETAQPLITITEGKAKRTVIQQAELQYNSIVKKYMDRGYKDLVLLTNKKFEELDAATMDSLVPTIATDASGNVKPMLAKSSDSVRDSIFNKKLFCSKKLDGVRCLMKYEDGEVKTISRGGKNYDGSTIHITKELKPFFEKNPDIVLDGELYHHGMHLQELSGLARTEEWKPECEALEYWVYDIADGENTFNKRLDTLIDLRLEFEDYKYVQVLEHTLTESWLEIKKLHDRWVNEGYEGLVARKHNKPYGFGKRNSDMIKVKVYQDAEFKIVGIREGLRDEDFSFECVTENGDVFAAKPIGDRALKEKYREDIDNIIGKMGTVKFFDWSKEGIPLQPIFQVIRDYE